MPRCFISLGGNVGPVAETFTQAFRRLGEHDRINAVAHSGFYRTAPVGERAGGAFLNAAAGLDTDLGPHELLTVLQRVEDEFGRDRRIRWGPRPLDLDLIFYGQQVLHSPQLELPHPACWYRRFVLQPLAEIAADVVHPVKGVTVRELLHRLGARPMRLALAGGDRTLRTVLMGKLEAAFPNARFLEWQPAGKTDEPEPTLIVWLGPCDGVDGSSAGSEVNPLGAACEFDSLPPVPRLDATVLGGDVTTAVFHVIKSALGK